ncbi:anoctamin-8 isoform X3 [Calypte anna]|uniref:anoctamin-8 isoform X3 n=1 Tax=Calypte anna TaxID=9244 RepID=UPI0011C35CF7|nr:anoctamin-8 isoform X3 [Calypte anna]
MPEDGDRSRRAPAGEERTEPAAPTGVLDKLFGKRLLQAGRYIMSHKAWMKTVPTENCDVLMTFPDTTDDHTLLWLLNHIRLGIPELIVQVRHHKHTRVYAFFVTATYESLLRGADEIGLRKPVKAEFGGGMRSFSCEEDYIYENIENELYFFTSQERQNIIRYWLENLRAKQGESLHNIHFLEGQPIIPELAARGVIQQVFPLHEQRILKRLMKSWVQAVCEAQPLDEICDYFGVKIAMYFAWLGFYTSAMVYPAVFGSLLYTFTESDQEWKRRGAEFAYKWGTLDTPAESIEEPRPQFRGVKRISPVTSAEEFYYPPWKRLLFQCLVSLPVCLACLSCVFLLMLGCFQLQEFVLSIQELPRIIRFLPKIILAAIVTACDEVYKKIAYWLNDMENYRLQSAYEKHLIIKIVLFQFVNSYLSLFYIGFYLKDMERLKELLLIFSLSQSLTRQLKEALLPFILLHLHLSLIFFKGLLGFCWKLGVSKMLATLLITRQFLQNVREVSQPHLYRRLRRGDLDLRSLRQVANAILQLLAPRRHPPAPSERSRGDKKCLNGGCGVPEEEEEEEERRESDSEEESALDCGLKLKKVSFIERGERRGGEPGGPEEESFLEEGSPTMVEKGMDPAAVFELCEEEEEEAEGLSGSPGKALEPAAAPRAGRRRRGAEGKEEEEEEEGEEEGRKRNRASWIDPPEEDYSTQLTQAEVESCMKKYEDTFQDYQEMFIQFGYVVLFSSAFPLAAMCALVNNVIEIRSDAFKLCTGLQRPFGQRVESIGQWQKVMEAMGVLAIVVNCYLIAQCGQLQRLFPWLSPEGAIISVVVLEHLALFLKYIIQVAIPDIPAWVAEEMAKLEYQRREAFKKHERQAQHHFQQQQRRKREEEERQRHAEYQARREREATRDETKPEAAGQDPAQEKSQSKGKSSGGSSSHGSDKPKRPSSLLATNNVMKLKQIIPLQGKFLSGGAGGTATSRSPQSPTENKLPGFLSFKFLKSPETKRDAGTEKVQSPTKPFNPGKLFNFGKSEGTGGNGTGATSSPQPRPGTSAEAGERAAPSKSHLNGMPEEGSREEPESQAEEESGGHRL